VKKALIVGLIVLVVVTGIPIIVGMPNMAICQDCGSAALFGQGCGLAVLAVGAILMAMRRRRLAHCDQSVHFEFHRFALERPPQLA